MYVLYSEWILLKINNINYNFVIFSTETLLWFSYKKAIKNTSLHLNANDVHCASALFEYVLILFENYIKYNCNVQ